MRILIYSGCDSLRRMCCLGFDANYEWCNPEASETGLPKDVWSMELFASHSVWTRTHIFCFCRLLDVMDSPTSPE